VTGAVAVKLATPSAPRCEIDDSALGDAWDEPRRHAVDAALARVAGVDAARLVHAELDDYAQTWLSVRREACAATRERGEQTELQLARRVACLDRGRRELGELSRVLASG